MRAGELRHYCQVEGPTAAQNEYGEPLETWGVVGELWAKKEDLSGDELIEAQRVNAAVATRFTTRWRDDLEPTYRLNLSGTPYNIEAILDPEGRRRMLVLLCSKED